MEMNLSGADVQTIHECLIAVSLRPPWVEGEFPGRLLDRLVNTWPDVDRTPEVDELIVRALSQGAQKKESEGWVTAPPAEIEALIDRIKKGIPSDGPADPHRLFARARGYDRIGAATAAQTFRLRALDAAQDDPEARCQILTGLAHYELGMGNFHAALQSTEQAMPLLRSVKDPGAAGETLLTHARALDANDKNVDPAALKDALEAFLRADFKRLAGEALELLAVIDETSAKTHLEQAIPLFEASESSLGAPRVLRKLSEATGDPAHASRALELLHAARAGAGVRLEEASCLEVLGDLHRKAGDEERARADYSRSVEILDRLEHGRARNLRAKLGTDKDSGPRVHPSIKRDPWMTVKVSRHRTAARSDEAVECARRNLCCGVCAGDNIRYIFYRDESGDAVRKYFAEVLCLACGQYTTWDYDD